ncbi:hypothetical protein HQN89_07350 [Paenibacillus frigoriresistens]|uniref:hypothetical protein n=1 Tax=Paenibacillus alginolyticus TaxID=59839 RepID=UPI00156632FA|nr:hypothetical protein [Paenibacillus frigoriresistens]NRF90843.1 hypothetical protein [Paenibacillus frigoriresistens]
MLKESHYPSFDVMNEQDEWDDHTQTIVTSRLKSKAGLKAIEQGTRLVYASSFLDLDIAKQKQYLHQISESIAEPQEVWIHIPQEALYVRTELGQLDPWEAQPEQ